MPPRTHVLRGWCFADDARRLDGIRAVLPDRLVEGTYGLKRLDVLASVRDKPQAEYCGWRLELELREGDALLDLETRDTDGRWHRFFHADLKVGEGLGAVDLTAYEKWIEVYDRITPERLQAQAAESATFATRPLISVLVPVYNTPERWLVKAVESVQHQSYPNWELCLADDASPQAHVRPLLEKLAREDPRIKVTFREKNGHISACSNSALALATGEFVALLDHDDELTPHALFEVANLLNAKPATDYIYSDEDKIDEDGRRHEPYFKPDYLPDLFLAQNYTSHLSVYRTALVREVGGFRQGYEGSQDWDLALRVVDRSSPDRIRHIPKVLYHWRAIPGSTALLISEKNYPLEAARRALTDHFARRGQPVTLEHVPGDHWRVRYPLPDPAPTVSLIIPTRNGLKFLQRGVDSILEKTAYPSFEVIVMDNGSDDPATLAYLKKLSDGSHPLLRPGHAARVIRHDAPFNYSVINNRGVSEARGEIVGLLNNDLEVINPGWLEEMVAQAVRPGIGCVGAMLYYPNDTIQHAGVVVGLGGVAGHAFRDFPRATHGKFNRARLVQNYSAVTAACLLVRKSTYQQVGGLDEKDLAVAFNDIDFCLKVQAAGFRNLWTPFAELYHHESATRGADDNPEKAARFQREVETMLRRWGPVLTSDPAYNPNLTLELNDFSLAVPPRSWRPDRRDK
jgi:glycosyltransferase involved in cell wall biosynthesis